MSRSIFPAVVTTLLAAASTLPAAVSGAQDAPPAAARTSADSSFTEAQAERGLQVFSRVCLECHERSEMSNPDFRLKWGGQSTFDLFKSIATTMPDSDPGSLPRGDYTDVVAYILKLNGIPAGVTELVADSAQMSGAKITPREAGALGMRRPGATSPSRPAARRAGLAAVVAHRRRATGA